MTFQQLDQYRYHFENNVVVVVFGNWLNALNRSILNAQGSNVSTLHRFHKIWRHDYQSPP